MEVSEFIETFSKESEQLVRETFPKKVLEIDELFKKVKEENKRYIEQECHYGTLAPVDNVCFSTEPSSKRGEAEGDVNIYSSGLIGPKNELAAQNTYQDFVHKYCQTVKLLLYDIKEHAIKVKMWLNFLIPKTEDGKNVAVPIQNMVVDAASLVDEEVNIHLGSISNYYHHRAKLSSKIDQYPYNDDYMRCIKDWDDTQMANLQTAILGLRNHYATLYDIIMKNVDKIKVPRTNSSRDM